MNKTIITLSFLSAILLASSIGVFCWGKNQQTSKEIYRTKLENKDSYCKKLEEEYKILQVKYEKLKEHTGLTYDYQNGDFMKKPKQNNINWNNVNLSNVIIPESKHNTEYIPNTGTFNSRPVYTEQKTDYTSSTEIQERRLMEAESKINHLEAESDMRLFLPRPLKRWF